MSARFKTTTHRPRIDKALATGTRRGLTDAGMVWHGDVVRITPVDSGLLRQSIAWEVTGVNAAAGKPAGRVRLGSNLEYAPAVHENLDAHHPVGQAKFIETPLRENRDKYLRLVADAIREVME